MRVVVARPGASETVLPGAGGLYSSDEWGLTAL